MPVLAVEKSATRNDLAMGQPGCASFVMVTPGLGIAEIHKNHNATNHKDYLCGKISIIHAYNKQAGKIHYSVEEACCDAS